MSSVTHGFLSLELNVLSALQFQSAHSAGSTHRSTAVCALQVLLVTFPHSSACSHAWRWETLVALRRVLLVCSQLLPVLAVQIHAKLSVPQTRGQKRRCGFLFFCCSKALMNTRSTKNSPWAQESRCCLQSCYGVSTSSFLALLFVSLFSGGWLHNFNTQENEKKLHSIHLQSAGCCEQLHVNYSFLWKQ